MSQPKTPDPAKLIIGIFLKEKDLFLDVTEILTEKFGPIDMVSRWFPFNFTAYYEPEMGTFLFRRMLVFKELILQDELVGIKLFTNNVEKKFSERGKRKVNIDPGYLLRERFVLATGKNYSHRIYIGKRIYADLTLVYEKGGFKTLPWTYPDYGALNIQNFLKRARKKNVIDLKKGRLNNCGR